MISIKKPYIESLNNHSYLKARVIISDDSAKAWMECRNKLSKTHWRFYENYPPKEWENGELWFEVDKQYEKYLCADRADAFIVAFLYYAMLTGSDIECESPVSEQMLFGIENHLFPALLKEEKGYKKIKIIANPISERYKTENKVGTGMSCGVDSLYTLYKYNNKQITNQYQLTHLTYFNMGAIFHPNTAKNKVYQIDEFYETTDLMSEEKRTNAQMVADRVNMPLVYVKSNLDKDYYRGAYGYTGVYRNCAMVLALQGLFGKYYCSSAGWPDFFDLSLTEGSEHYETLLCSSLSNGTVEFIISDFATRYEKTKSIANYDIAKDFLDVCFNFNSCGMCSKCMRTLITLELLDKLDQFKNVFNIDEYYANRDKAYAWLIETKNGDELDDNVVFAKDIYRLAHDKGIIPIKAYLLYTTKIFFNNIKSFISIFKRIFAKIKRIWRKIK